MGGLSDVEILRIVKAAWPDVVQHSGLSLRAMAVLADSHPTQLELDGDCLLRVQAPCLDQERWKTLEFLEEALELTLADFFGGEWWVEITGTRNVKGSVKDTKSGGNKSKRNGQRIKGQSPRSRRREGRKL